MEEMRSSLPAFKVHTNDNLKILSLRKKIKLK